MTVLANDRSIVRRWAGFWSHQEDAFNRHRTEPARRFAAAELALLLPERCGDVLELGCGAGELHGFLRDRFDAYLGVDYSDSMLRRFVADWPGVETRRADIAALPDLGRTFDVIFSNGVAQFLDARMLDASIARAAAHLRPGGTHLIGNIPDAALRFLFYGHGLDGRRFSLSFALRNLLAVRVLGRCDGIGLWHRRADVAASARRHGLECRVHSSLTHEYRFHAVLHRPA